MKPEFKPGVAAELEFTVTNEMRAGFDGKVVHDVLSTVTMIYYMEKAGREVILPYLEEDEEGAGLAVNVKHVGPAVVGQRVKVRAVCTEVTANRVVCDVSAETEYNQVGIGTFTQAIFKKRDMAKKIEELQQRVRAANTAAPTQLT